MTTHEAAHAASGAGAQAVAPDEPARRWGGWGTVGMRLAAAGGAALVLGAVKIHRPPQLATLCVLRAATGIPCPLCGSTTAFTRLGQGRVADALLANPVVLIVALCLVLAPTGVFAALGRAPQRVVWTVMVVATGTSWLWQLGRLGYLS